MGSREDKVPLLVDTTVNGSAANYNTKISQTSINRAITSKVSNIYSAIEIEGE